MEYNAILYKSAGEKFVAEGVEINQLFVGNCGREAVNGLVRAIEDAYAEHKKDSRVELWGSHSPAYNSIVKRINFRNLPSRMVHFSDNSILNGSILRVYEEIK